MVLNPVKTILLHFVFDEVQQNIFIGDIFDTVYKTEQRNSQATQSYGSFCPTASVTAVCSLFKLQLIIFDTYDTLN